MSNITWWIKGKKTIDGQPVRKYWKTSLDKILNMWNSKNELKICKISYNDKEYIEFIIYNSEPYTRGNKLVYSSCVIFDRFQILITNNTVKSSTFKEEFNRSIKRCPKRKVNIKHWYDKETTRDELNRLYDLFDNLEAYQVMDKLLGEDDVLKMWSLITA